MKRVFEKLATGLALLGLATSAMAVKINAPGDINNFAPAVVTVMGVSNAATATKWATARTITLTGSITGSCSIDGSADCSITTSGGGGVPTTRQINTTAPLTGGGDLSADRTISLTPVGTAGTYGDSTHVPVFTTDASGRITTVTNTAIAGGSGSCSACAQLASANVFTAANTFNTTVSITSGGLNISGPLTSTTLGGSTVSFVTANSEATSYQYVAGFNGATYGSIAAGSSFYMQHARGTFASPTNIANADEMGQMVWWGYGGGAFRVGAKITAAVTETTPSATAMGSSLTLYTTPAGTVSPVAALTLASNQTATFSGNVSVNAGAINFSAPAGNQRALNFQTSGANRNAVFTNSATETGSNVGSDMVIRNYGDDGVTELFSTKLTRSTGNWSFPASASFVGNVTANNQALGWNTIASDAAATYTLAITAGYTQYLNVPITANRTVTLPAVSAGTIFRFVRTTASTGAFTWSIGGLKSLGAGTWCDIQAIGSSWVETAYGSL